MRLRVVPNNKLKLWLWAQTQRNSKSVVRLKMANGSMITIGYYLPPLKYPSFESTEWWERNSKNTTLRKPKNPTVERIQPIRGVFAIFLNSGSTANNVSHDRLKSNLNAQSRLTFGLHKRKDKLHVSRVRTFFSFLIAHGVHFSRNLLRIFKLNGCPERKNLHHGEAWWRPERSDWRNHRPIREKRPQACWNEVHAGNRNGKFSWLITRLAIQSRHWLLSQSCVDQIKSSFNDSVIQINWLINA